MCSYEKYKQEKNRIRRKSSISFSVPKPRCFSNSPMPCCDCKPLLSRFNDRMINHTAQEHRESPCDRFDINVTPIRLCRPRKQPELAAITLDPSRVEVHNGGDTTLLCVSGIVGRERIAVALITRTVRWIVGKLVFGLIGEMEKAVEVRFEGDGEEAGEGGEARGGDLARVEPGKMDNEDEYVMRDYASFVQGIIYHIVRSSLAVPSRNGSSGSFFFISLAGVMEPR